MRNRRGMVAAVEPFDSPSEGRVHLVSIEYLDPDGQHEETSIWEREPGAQLLEPTALPDPIRDGPMQADEFDALVNATRWTARSPFLDPDGETGPLQRLPISAPFHGAIQVEDFQLVPLLKALRMPRISLLLADDVGLGKTIEAGLILAELLQPRSEIPAPPPGARGVGALKVFQEFRTKVRRLVSAAPRTEQTAGSFAVEVLGKRLLSCPVAFADSWHRYKQGMMAEEAAGAEEVRAAEKSLPDELTDDREVESCLAHAAATVSAWLKPLAEHLTAEMKTIDCALAGLNLQHADTPPDQARPAKDSRFEALKGWIETHLRSNGKFRQDERLVIFTE